MTPGTGRVAPIPDPRRPGSRQDHDDRLRPVGDRRQRVQTESDRSGQRCQPGTLISGTGRRWRDRVSLATTALMKPVYRTGSLRAKPLTTSLRPHPQLRTTHTAKSTADEGAVSAR